MVDLDAARTGTPENRPVIAAIAAAVGGAVQVQAGGGVRDQAVGRGAAGGGRRPGGDRHRRGRAPRAGAASWPPTTRWRSASTPGAGRWRCGAGLEGSGVDLFDLLARFEDGGVAAFVVTDIGRDGTLAGPDLDGLAAVLEATAVDVIASGGVGSLADLDRPAPRWRSAAAGWRGRSWARPSTRALHGGGGDGRVRTVRVIPCLDVDAGRVVKGVNFVDLRDAGDPVELAARYDAEGADELVFLDITASSDAPRHHGRRRPPHRRAGLHPLHRRRRHPHASTTPARLLRAGADKVGVNTAAVDRPELITELAGEFGAQCVVVAIDARRRRPTTARAGRSSPTAAARPTGLDAVAWAGECVRAGRGRDPAHLDGPRRHPRRLRPRAHPGRVSDAVRRAGHRQRRRRHARPPGRRRRSTGGADAVLAASIFHFGEHTVGEAKDHLAARGITVRP